THAKPDIRRTSEWIPENDALEEPLARRRPARGARAATLPVRGKAAQNRRRGPPRLPAVGRLLGDPGCRAQPPGHVPAQAGSATGRRTGGGFLFAIVASAAGSGAAGHS